MSLSHTLHDNMHICALYLVLLCNMFIKKTHLYNESPLQCANVLIKSYLNK